jgi:hypothetical protein
MTTRWTIAFAVMLAATAWAEDLLRKSKGAREIHPNVDVICDSVIAPDGIDYEQSSPDRLASEGATQA